jgi:dipeptidase E
LRRDLAGVGLAWLRGGNVFMLLFALFRGAGDIVFRDLLAADALVCAGYSAGGCVLSSTLRGLEAVDDVGAVMRIYGSEPAWDGLALFKEAFALRRARPAAAAGSCRGEDQVSPRASWRASPLARCRSRAYSSWRSPKVLVRTYGEDSS